MPEQDAVDKNGLLATGGIRVAVPHYRPGRGLPTRSSPQGVVVSLWS